MLILRRILVLSCLQLLFSCASRPAPVPIRHPEPDGPADIDFEPQPVLAAAAQAPNPSAPTRSSNRPHYSWQSPTPSQPCLSDPVASEPEVSTVLTFSGSVGIFPPLPEEDPATPPVLREPADTWGSGEHPKPERAATPDLVVASLRPGFRHCFSRWLDDKADAQGSVRFALELGCAGDVRTISADSQGVDEPTLECLFAVVAPAQFGPPANGHATIQVPVVFKNAER